MRAISISKSVEKIYTRGDGRFYEKLTKLVQTELEKKLPLQNCKLRYVDKEFGDRIGKDEQYDMSMVIALDTNEKPGILVLHPRTELHMDQDKIYIDWLSLFLSKRDVKTIQRSCSEPKKKK